MSTASLLLLQCVVKQARASVTTHDVARAAAVSRVTVSRVLNNHASVTSTVRERVLRAAVDLGYFGQQARPWVVSAGGRQGRPLVVLPTIGFFFTSVYPDELAAGNPFWSHVLRGVERGSSALGISLIYRSVHPSASDPEMLKHSLSAALPGGILLVGPASQEMVRTFVQLGRPLVLVENQVPLAGVDAVLSDNFAGGRAAVEHLLANGHRNIAFIGGPTVTSPAPVRHRTNTIWSIEQRALGYWTALREAGVQPRAELFESDNLSTAGGYRACKRLLARAGAFSGIFCANDETAIGAIRALREAGRAVPDDVSVVGFDDIALVDHLNPPLTTLRVHKEAIGAAAVRQLLERALVPDAVPTTVTLGVELIQRGSVAGAT